MKQLKGSHLVIRVDAGGEIGAGHLMRCLALAQAWQDAGGQAIFIIGFQNEGLQQRLQKEGFDIHQLTNPYPHDSDWGYTKSLLDDYPDAWLILDGYHFDEIYQKRIKDAGHKLLVIDDMAHLKHYYTDILLNQNLHAESSLYSCEPDTRLLLGSRYVLLNRDFLIWKDWRREFPEVGQRLLVTLGGSDSNNNTLKVIEALQEIQITGLEVKVVVGASNPHLDTLEKAIGHSRISIPLILDARNMPELMTWADVAISAGGYTAWELAFTGMPVIMMVSAENQRRIAESLDIAGAAINLGWDTNITAGDIAGTLLSLLKSKQKRQEMSLKGRQIVDGQGGRRVVSALENSC